MNNYYWLGIFNRFTEWSVIEIRHIEMFTYVIKKSTVSFSFVVFWPHLKNPHFRNSHGSFLKIN